MKIIIINSCSEILKFKNIYDYNFIINKDFLLIKANIIILRKIVVKFNHITLNGLNGNNLYIYLNYYLYYNNLDFIYKEYKIVMKGLGCNAKCPMCFDWKRKGDLKKQFILLNEVLKDIYNENILFKSVNLLGGEPILMYDRLLELIIQLKKYNINLNFPTNASLLDEKKIDELIFYGLDKFEFSIDFPNIKHDEWRSLKGTFEKILKFTNYIKNKGKKVCWNTVVGTFNYDIIIDFSNIYDNSKPDTHTFIIIENNYKSTNNKLLPNNDSILRLENDIKNSLGNYGVEILLNGFRKNIKSNSKKCHIPLYKKSYIIKNNKINISPCYTHTNIINFKNFINDAIIGDCRENCDSSCRKSYTFFE